MKLAALSKCDDILAVFIWVVNRRV